MRKELFICIDKDNINKNKDMLDRQKVLEKYMEVVK